MPRVCVRACVRACVRGLSPLGVSGAVQVTFRAWGDRAVTRGAGTFSGVLSSVRARLGGLRVQPPPVQA